MSHITRLLVIASLFTGTAGCLVIGGGTTTRNAPNTLGRELLDLQAAREEGVLTEDEYATAKQNLLASRQR